MFSPKFTSFLGLIGFLLAVTASALVGGWAVSQSVGDWYVTLPKPSWNPPSWIFGPVWTVLFILMAIAAWTVWCKRTEQPIRSAMVAFWVQLMLNTLWSWCFFGWRSPGWALVEILILWVAIVTMTWFYARIFRLALWLSVPYVAWVSFAVVLNAAIVAS